MDNVALLYLVSKQALTGKLARWMLLLEEFDFDIHHQPGTYHAVVDYLSRIENRGDAMDGDEDLPDGAILHIDPPEDKWVTEMSEFLNTGLPPLWMRTDEKKRLAVRRQNFCMIHDTLYHKGSDGIWRTCITNEKKEKILQ